jgi:FixJ family two-component response regulator
MLVEDDPAVRRSLQMLLQSQGFDVRAHARGATLLADPACRGASCLVADYRLGVGEDGVSLLQDLRRRGWSAPAILITGHGSGDLTARALAAGFHSVIDKPLQPGALAALVARLIRPQDPASV